MARRLVERGVRYVQTFSGGGNFEPSWDAHWDLQGNHGLHATIQHLLGLDFEEHTYHFNGRNMRLSDVHGDVIREILA
jgi:hypothetical protein